MIEYKGNFDYYLEKTAAVRAESSQDSEPSEKAPAADVSAGIIRDSEAERQEKKKREAESRRRARRGDEIEERIHYLEGLIADIEEAMNDPARTSDFEWMHEQSEIMAESEAEISRLYDEWMELQ